MVMDGVPWQRRICLSLAFISSLLVGNSIQHGVQAHNSTNVNDGISQWVVGEGGTTSVEANTHGDSVMHDALVGTDMPLGTSLQHMSIADHAGDIKGNSEEGSEVSPAYSSKETEDDTTNLAAISDNVAELVSLCCFIILSACFLQFVISKINDKIPISIVCFIYGMVTYGISIFFEGQGRQDPLSRSIHMIRHMDSSVLYYIALPTLLYEATQDVNWYTFCNFIVGGISLAIVGVLLQVIFLGVLFHYVLNISSNGYVTVSFLLASILSSTDPVAVLSVLGAVNAPQKLSSIFHCESLINDGSSVLLFQFFYLSLLGQSQSWMYYVSLFIKLLLLGPLLGLLVGIVVTVWISLFRKHYITQCVGVITTGHLVYFLAEYTMNLSGPLAIVCYGVFIKAYGLIAFDREALEKHDHFVEGICLIANSAVFVISGALTVGMLRVHIQADDVWMHVGKLLLTYLLTNLARAFMIVVFSPLLSYIGYGINYKEMILLIWGGLRGAIVLVLGLRLESDPNIPDKLSDLLAFYSSGNVMIILLLQGLTFEVLYRLLNPYPMKPFRRVYLVKVMNMIDCQFNHHIGWMKDHWLFKNTDAVIQGHQLVPKMATIRWNATGNIEFDIPHVDHNLDRCAQPPSNCDIESAEIDHRGRCATVYSRSSIPSDEDDAQQESPMRDLEDHENSEDAGYRRDRSDEGSTANMPLLTYGILKNSGPTDDLGYNPTMYLRLLEHAFTEDVALSHASTLSQTMDLAQLAANPQLNESARFSVTQPSQRFDTDATINVESLYKRPVHTRFLSMSVVPRMQSDDRLFENSDVHGLDNFVTHPVGPHPRRVLRKEREGELYIMIFNSFSDIYNKLYQSGLIDGGSLLLLQNALDVASDFALKKLKKRSIAAWAGALNEVMPDNSSGYNLDSVEDMGGFEFEWFVLHSTVEKRMRRIDRCFGNQFLNYSQHNDVQSVLELLVAYIDVHQHLLKSGGRNLELLLEEKLLSSYKRPITQAKLYIASLKNRWPQHVRHGLVTMTTCMMLRIKRDIVNEQSTHGLLLEEDRRKVVELLEEQLFRVATKHNRINVFKRFFTSLFHEITCHVTHRISLV